jgi:hypothetical protein
MSISELRDKVALPRDDLSATTDAMLNFDGFQSLLSAIIWSAR